MVKSAKSSTKATSLAVTSHPPYKVLITEAIIALKDRKGSSRQALKKYIQSNWDVKASNFDSQVNLALRRGVAGGEFSQPKGPAGTVKLVKKEKPISASKTEKSPPKPTSTAKPSTSKAKKVTTKPATAKIKQVAPKKTAAKKTAPKKAAPKKPAPKKATPKKPAPKKAAPKKAVSSKTSGKVTKAKPTKKTVKK